MCKWGQDFNLHMNLLVICHVSFKGLKKSVASAKKQEF